MGSIICSWQYFSLKSFGDTNIHLNFTFFLFFSNLRGLFGMEDFERKSKRINSLGNVSQLAVWNKANLHSFPKERLFTKHRKKKHPREPKGKIPTIFSQVLKHGTLLLGHIWHSSFPVNQTLQSFYSCVFKSCSFLLFALFYSCVFFHSFVLHSCVSNKAREMILVVHFSPLDIGILILCLLESMRDRPLLCWWIRFSFLSDFTWLVPQGEGSALHIWYYCIDGIFTWLTPSFLDTR